MGSWNATCGVSQLPIKAGEKVKAFLLLQNNFGDKQVRASGTTHSTDYFKPWFFPFDAEYNDCGSVESIKEDWNSRYVLEQFQKWQNSDNLAILPNDLCEVNSPEITKFKTLDDVFDCAERGALAINFYNPCVDIGNWIQKDNTLRIGIFLVLESVYNEIVTANDFIIRNGPDYIRNWYNKDKKELIQTIELLHSGDVVNTSMLTMYLSHGIEEHRAYNHYTNILRNKDKVSTEDFLKKFDASVLFHSAMTGLRKFFLPQSGAGSQNDGYELYKHLAISMVNHITLHEKEEELAKIEDEKWEKDHKAKQSAKLKKAKSDKKAKKSPKK